MTVNHSSTCARCRGGSSCRPVTTWSCPPASSPTRRGSSSSESSRRSPQPPRSCSGCHRAAETEPLITFHILLIHLNPSIFKHVSMSHSFMCLNQKKWRPGEANFYYYKLKLCWFDIYLCYIYVIFVQLYALNKSRLFFIDYDIFAVLGSFIVLYNGDIFIRKYRYML